MFLPLQSQLRAVLSPAARSAAKTLLCPARFPPRTILNRHGCASLLFLFKIRLFSPADINLKLVFPAQYAYDFHHAHGVLRVDEIKTRMFGNKIYVDVEIGVTENMPLKEAHAIAENAHAAIEKFDERVKHCMVHVNPVDEKE